VKERAQHTGEVPIVLEMLIDALITIERLGNVVFGESEEV
jgi:hypothetical protein